MNLKVLITCPPMLKNIDFFRDKFEDLGIEITTPDIIQTLSVEELIKIVPNHDGWIIGDDPASSAVFEAGKAGMLKAAVKWGIGVDNVDFHACRKLNIPITNTPGMFGAEVADLAMCYLLGLARDAFYIDREVRAGKWPKPVGSSLSGKTVGILGLGDIGKNIAKRCNAHDLKIIGWDPFAKNLPKYINFESSWPGEIEKCDFLVFACALTKETRNIFSNELLNKLKNGVRVINISRGPLIDEGALIKGLSSGKIKSAALDVFLNEPLQKEHKILNHPKCILGSHNASNTFEAVNRASEEAIDIIYKFLIKKINTDNV